MLLKSLGSLPADCPILCVITIGYGISTVFLANPFGSGVVAKALRVFPNIIRGLASNNLTKNLEIIETSQLYTSQAQIALADGSLHCFPKMVHSITILAADCWGHLEFFAPPEILIILLFTAVTMNW